MPPLAPLSYHAIPLHRKFKTMDEVLEAYCHGCKELSARECQAVFACVVSMFTHWCEFKTDLHRFYESHEATARLSYASLFALRKMLPSSEKEELKKKFSQLHAHVTGKPCYLFAHKSDTAMPGISDPDAALCKVINESICHADILKMIS